MGYWSSIENNYKETEEVFNKNLDGDIIEMIYIDAWKADSEAGESIAKVLKTKSGDICVVYQDTMARRHEGSQKIIQESIAELRGGV